jgi:hypothetical protein
MFLPGKTVLADINSLGKRVDEFLVSGAGNHNCKKISFVWFWHFFCKTSDMEYVSMPERWLFSAVVFRMI